MLHTLAWGMPGLGEWIVIGIIATILFGKRLPEVGRSLGKGIVEFKKGLKGIEEDIDTHVNAPPTTPGLPTPAAPRSLSTDYKYDPYTGEPIREEPTVSRETQKPAFKFDPYTGQPVNP